MTQSSENQQTDSQELNENPGFFSIIWSVLAALFGVQTETNRKRDFSQQNPLPYIIAFVVLLILFVLSIAGIVKLVISLTGS